MKTYQNILGNRWLVHPTRQPENTKVWKRFRINEWLEDRYIMGAKLFCKSSHPYSLLAWLELYIDWTKAMHAKGMISAPNKPVSNKPLDTSRNHVYIFTDSTRNNEN